jgi:coenzyme F420 hydrogenase subunit beta
MIDKNLKIYDEVCTGCSACTEACFFPDENGVLPINLIQKENKLSVPRINLDTCVDCKACYRACPTEDKIYNNSDLTFENYKKKIGESYFGYSLNEKHRYEAATAGIITEIGSYLLDSNQVDGVLSTYQDENTNEIISEIYTNSEDLRKTKGSIYRQVTLLNGLDKKIKDGNYKKILVIGLPCHIAGINSLKKANKYLRKNIEFITISIFCKQTKTEEFSNYMRSVLNAKENEKINFRGNGWPGVTKTATSNKLIFTNVKFNFNWPTFAFTPEYCFTCSDPLGVNADISVGDAWLQKYKHDKIGSSLFIANSEIGKTIINELSEKNKIYSESETKENIIKSQSIKHIKFKTSNPIQRDISFGTKRRNDKNINISKNYIRLIKWIKLNKYLLEFLERRRIINIMPNIIIKIYGKIYSFIFNIFSKEKIK